MYLFVKLLLVDLTRSAKLHYYRIFFFPFDTQLDKTALTGSGLTDSGWLDSVLNCDGGGGRLFGTSPVGRLTRIGCNVCGDGDGDARNWLNCKQRKHNGVMTCNPTRENPWETHIAPPSHVTLKMFYERQLSGQKRCTFEMEKNPKKIFGKTLKNILSSNGCFCRKQRFNSTTTWPHGCRRLII